MNALDLVNHLLEADDDKESLRSFLKRAKEPPVEDWRRVAKRYGFRPTGRGDDNDDRDILQLYKRIHDGQGSKLVLNATIDEMPLALWPKEGVDDTVRLELRVAIGSEGRDPVIYCTKVLYRNETDRLEAICQKLKETVTTAWPTQHAAVDLYTMENWNAL